VDRSTAGATHALLIITSTGYSGSFRCRGRRFGRAQIRRRDPRDYKEFF